MAYYTHTKTNSVVERGLAFMADIFAEAAARYARYSVYRETLTELRAIGDRELADLGMNRSMLSSVAWQAALEHEAR